MPITREEAMALAERVGLDKYETTAEQLVAAVSDLAARTRSKREFADDPTAEILRLDTTMPTEAVRGTTPDDPFERDLDAAVARGAVEMHDRPAWRTRYAKAPDLTVEILDALPGDPALADRAYAEDPRIRGLGDALDSCMGVESERAYGEAERRDPDLLDFS
jgi:hypothetical protein